MKGLLSSVQEWITRHTPPVNHKAVVRDISNEVEITPGYFLALNIANLIALCGLLLGSSPVIIGAMLISPLMGPILSFGFAFVTGDETIWRKAIRKLLISITLSILVAALATIISPLDELTGEILARTRPNLYDLIIAFLAGIVGAGALCTKKSYLTIVPGVAIATAVIPPLSVTGFGLATFDLKVCSGGFLLFFTNFVAIVLATCTVFYYYGFRRKMANDVELSHMKKRFTFLLAVLILISIPLALTLKSSIREVRLNNAIATALHQELEQEKRSHLVGFSSVEQDDGRLAINVQLNTVRYLSEDELAQVEKLVARNLKREVALNLEQVLVQAGGLKPELARTKPTPPQAPAHGQVLRAAQSNVRSLMLQATQHIDRIIAPASVADYSFAIDKDSEGATVLLKIHRDMPLSPDERLWLKRLLARELELPVSLAIETVPYIPMLSFTSGETGLPDQVKEHLVQLCDIYRRSDLVTVKVAGLSEQRGARGRKQATERARQVAAYLSDECQIPRDRIKISSSTSNGQGQGSSVRVTLQPFATPPVQ